MERYTKMKKDMETNRHIEKPMTEDTGTPKRTIIWVKFVSLDLLKNLVIFCGTLSHFF